MLTNIEKEFMDGAWKPLYRLEQKLSKLGFDDYGFSSQGEYIRYVVDNILSNDFHKLYVITERGEQTGILDFKLYTYEGKIEFAKVKLRHMTGDLSDIQTTEIANLLITLLDEHELKSLIVESPKDEIDRFFGKLGAYKINQLNYYRLDLHTADDLLVENWLNNSCIADDKDYALEFTEFIPDHRIEEFTTVFTELMNDIFREGKGERFQETPDGLRNRMNLFKSQDTKLIAYLLFYRNRMIGMTFTLVRGGQDCASQEMTGVTKEFRGKKLGRYLKAKMLMKIRNDYPWIKCITTDCYDVNKPIIDINLRMGYRTEKRVCQFRLMKESLVETINSSGRGL